MVKYAPDGLFGVLTPQANTTVEPELSILCPPGVAMITARLTSDKPIMEDRLRDYVLTIDKALDQFASAPLSAVAFACTGASYLVPPVKEAATLERISAIRGYPLVTAANAVADALAVLGATKVGIISPYGDPLHAQAISYWRARGVGIAEVERIQSDDKAFHPIYALGASAAREKLSSLCDKDLDAVVLLGTGLATLPAILGFKADPFPILSPNLCVMWRVTTILRGEAPSSANLAPWLTGEAWEQSFQARVQA